MPKYAVVFFAAIAFLAGCAGRELDSEGPNGQTAQVTAPTDQQLIAGETLQILYTPARLLAVEPCGCSMRPLGGLVREWNAVERLRQTPAAASFYLTSGPNFITVGTTARSRTADRKKAEILLEAMELLKVTAYSPSASDATLGSDFLDKLAKKASFPFVSANVANQKTKRLLFKPYVELEARGRKILVTGLSGVPPKALRPKGVRILPAKAALAKVFAQAKGDYALVIVLSTLSREARDAVTAAFPQVNFILGGEGRVFDHDFVQETATVLRAEPDVQGKTVAAIEVQLPATGKPKQFFSPQMAQKWYGSSRVWEDELFSVEQRLHKKHSARRQRELEAEKKRYETMLTLSTSIINRQEGATLFASRFVSLDNVYEGTANNPMEALVKKFQGVSMQASTSRR